MLQIALEQHCVYIEASLGARGTSILIDELLFYWL